MDIKKDNNKSLLKIFGIFKLEYAKYTPRLCPSSYTMSKKFTAWSIQTIKVKVSEHNIKKNVTSKNRLLNIVFFIE